MRSEKTNGYLATHVRNADEGLIAENACVCTMIEFHCAEGPGFFEKNQRAKKKQEVS